MKKQFFLVLIVFGISALASSGAEKAISPSLTPEGFPLESGIMVLDRQGTVKAFYPVSGAPTSVDVLPGRQEFAVVTASGIFIIYTGNGDRVFNTRLSGLQDVDALDTPDEFLLTSRVGKRVFFYNRKTGKRRDVPGNFEGPEDADRLANGHLLVCDSKANRVVELTSDGTEVWSYEKDLVQPMDALRLPNGNTVISDFDNHRVLEVKPDGGIVSIRRGFNHPRKLTRLPNGSILVADSDQQILQEITPNGKQRILRDRLNYIQAAVYVPEEQLILCAVQKRFPPTPIPADLPKQSVGPVTKKQTPKSVQPSSTPGWSHPYFLLGLAVVLWGIRRVSRERKRLSGFAFTAAYGLTLWVLYELHTIAASHSSHSPGIPFWIGAVVLLLLGFRYTKHSFKPKEQWLAGGRPMKFPFEAKTVLFLLGGSMLAAAAQCGHLWGVGNWGKIPWTVPMAIWGVTLYILLRPLILRRGSENSASFAESGETFRWRIPFSTGSVAMDGEDDESGDISDESRFSAYWTNTPLIPILLLILGAALYSIGATLIPTDVHGDECEVGLHAIEIRDSGNWNFFNLSWYHIPNLFYLIPGWVMWLFGDNLFGLRMAGAVTGLSAIPVFYLLARRLLHPTPAALAAFLFTISTFFVHFSRMGTGYNQAILLTVAVLYALVRSIQDSDTRFVCLAGVLSAVGFLSYQAAKILMPLAVLTLFVLWFARILSGQRFRVALGAFALSFWVGILPIAAINFAATDTLFSRMKGVSVIAQDGRNLMRTDHKADASMGDILAEQLRRSVLAPVTYQDKSPYLTNHQYGGMLDPFPAIFFTAGFLTLFFMLRHPTVWLLFLWLIPVLLLGSAITDHAPSYQRLVGLFPILILIAAPVLHGGLLGIGRACRWTERTRLQMTAVVLAVLLIMGMNRYFHQIMVKPQMVDEWTRVAHYLNDSGPTQYTYLFGPPHLYFKYGTIQFLAPGAKGENVEKRDEFLKNKVRRRGPVSFVLVRSHRKYIHKLRQLYPGGREEFHYNIEGGDPFTTYEVNL